MPLPKNKLSGERAKADVSLFGHYRGSANVMSAGDQYEEGKLKGANIGVAPRRRVDGNVTEDVPIGDDKFADHLKEEFRRSGA